jgi:hypothetical protein
MEVCVCTITIQGLVFSQAKHFYVLVWTGLRSCVAIFNYSIALALHHAREAQCFASEGAMTKSNSVLRVKDTDQMKVHKKLMKCCGTS